MKPWLATLGLALGILTIADFVSETITLSPERSYAIAFVAVCATVLLVALRTPRLPTVVAIAWVVGSTLMLFLLRSRTPDWPPLLLAMIVTTGLLAGGSMLGAFVGYRIEAAGHLLAVALVSSLADLYSVFHRSGPSAQIVSDAKTLGVMALPWPLLGTGDLVPILGVGDVIFAALYLAASHRHRLGAARTTAALFAGFVVTLGCVYLTARPIPALPFLGAAMLVAHPRARRLRLRT